MCHSKVPRSSFLANDKLVSTLFVLAEKLQNTNDRHEHQKYLSMGKINPRFVRAIHTYKMPCRHIAFVQKSCKRTQIAFIEPKIQI